MWRKKAKLSNFKVNKPFYHMAQATSGGVTYSDWLDDHVPVLNFPVMDLYGLRVSSAILFLSHYLY